MPGIFPCFSCGQSIFPPATQINTDDPNDDILSCIKTLGVQLCQILRQTDTAITDAGVFAGKKFVVFACTVRANCAEGKLWLGHKVAPMWRPTHKYVISPIQEGLAQIGGYTREHYRAVLAHLLAWGLILVCYGTLHGFNTVSLPMLIGMGPGCLAGMLIGALVAKTFHQPIKGSDASSSLVGRIQHHVDAVPSWTRTLLIAVTATIHLNICFTMPYAGGALSGAFFGGIYIYNGLRHHPKLSETPEGPLSAEEVAKAERLLAERLRELTTQAETLQQQLAALRAQLPPTS